MNSSNRAELVSLAKQLRDYRRSGLPDDHLVAQLRLIIDDPDADEYCWSSDLPIGTIVDVWMSLDDARRKLTKDEFVKVVDKMLGPEESTEADSILFSVVFDSNCIHPANIELFYHPERFFDGNSHPSAKEIVDKALLET